MFRRVSAVVFLTAATMISAARASGPVPRFPCGPHDEVIAYLGRYEERQIAMGLTAQGTLLEIFLAASGTWSIVITRADGASCVVAIGDTWLSTLTPDRPGA